MTHMSRFFLVNQKLAVQPGYSQIPKRLTFMSWFLVNQWHKGQPNDSHALVLLVSQKHTTWPGYADLQINDSHELFLVNQQHKAQIEKSDPQANVSHALVIFSEHRARVVWFLIECLAGAGTFRVKTILQRGQDCLISKRMTLMNRFFH